MASLITLLLPKILLEVLCYQMSSQVIYVNVTVKVMRCVWHESPRLAKKFAADQQLCNVTPGKGRQVASGPSPKGKHLLKGVQMMLLI